MPDFVEHMLEHLSGMALPAVPDLALPVLAGVETSWAISFLVVALVADFLSWSLGAVVYHKRWKAVLSVLFSVALSVFCAWLHAHLAERGMFNISTLVFVVAFLAKQLVFAYWRDGRFLFSMAFVTLLVFFLMYQVSLIMQFQLLPSGWTPIALAVLGIVLCLVTHFAASTYYRDLQENVPSGWATYSLIPLLSCAVVFVGETLWALLGFEYALAVCGVAFLFTLVSLFCFTYFFRQWRESFVLKSDVELLRDRERAQEQLDKERQAARDRERRLRHDQRHTFNVMIDQLDDGDYASVRERLVELRGDTFVDAEIDFCENRSVNTTLKTWSYRAQEQGIDMKIRADVPASLDADAMELAVLFGNLLENAYEGCLRLERTEAKRFIDFKCSYNKGKLKCVIRNSCRNDIVFRDGFPVSQKRGGSNIGTRSARAVVEEHDGQIRYLCEDGVFTTRFMMAV